MTSTIQIVFLALTFLVISGLTYLIAAQFIRPTEEKRLQSVAESAGTASPPATHSLHESIKHFLAPVAKLSTPEDEWEESPLRTRFMNAGFRGPYAPVVYFACKTLGTFLLPAAFALYTGMTQKDIAIPQLTAMIVLLAALGYYLPNVVLSRIIAHRQRELFENFPDALDLMRVCVEAGLGLDAAIARVGEEMRLKSEALYDELHLVSLELRAGSARDRALRNLALRMGLEDVDALVAMLVQAERFGTSVSESLRVHADGLRVKRKMRAEEAAAKVPVKLLFPLIFCIFPALLVVLLGPALISIYRVLLPTIAG
ncbi:type II secretion system F family protein [Noviherbaspirillum agri]